MEKSLIRSPLFYTGDKYKIINEIKKYFPQNINKFVEPFVGGGSVMMNTEAEKYLENDIDKNIISLHKYLSSFSSIQDLMNILLEKISEYNLSCSYQKDEIPTELKVKYKKTYFARYNKDAYYNLREKFNSQSQKDLCDMYLLLVYGFNHMLRFNRDGVFNLPVGNVDFNKNVYNSLLNYVLLLNQKNVTWFCEDYKKFLSEVKFEKGDFVYCDPPYLITASEYNKLWDEKDDAELFSLLDDLNERSIKFALSNVIEYKGKKNEKLEIWSKKYNAFPIESNFINYHDNSIKSFSEVLITNYEN